VHKTIIIAVKRAEFICDTESYIILRGHSWDIVLNVCSPTEDKTDYTKDSCYVELEHVFDHFPQ
jgi:hypothetical protein